MAQHNRSISDISSLLLSLSPCLLPPHNLILLPLHPLVNSGCKDFLKEMDGAIPAWYTVGVQWVRYKERGERWVERRKRSLGRQRGRSGWTRTRTGKSFGWVMPCTWR